MDYERIHKVQTGVISPSKLRLKLLGPHHHRGKEGGGSNSSRTSPSKLEDAEYAKSSLLASQNDDVNGEGSSKDSGVSSLHDVPNLNASVAKLVIEGISNSNQGPKDVVCKEIGDHCRVKIENIPKGFAHQVQFTNNLRSVHPMKSQDEDSTDYDSGHDNASSSSFEFHKGERTLHNPVIRHFSRPVPSKWNDAEKWIMNPNASKKAILQNQINRQAMANWMKVAPDSTVSDQRSFVAQPADTKRIDSGHFSSQIGLEKFAFVGSHPISEPAKGANGLADQTPNGDGLSNLPGDQRQENQNADTTIIPTIKSVSMRDTGTEMTPMTSQEPSRTGTPVGSTTPIRSPVSSIPSTPRRGEPTPSPAVATTDNEFDHLDEFKNKEFSEKELQLKTRREIVALGMQLGKMNIAAWASKEEKEVNAERLEKMEFEARAAAWEEAEKSKHTARYKREEIKIEAWESHQKAKFEAQMRRIEAEVEQMRAHSQEQMMNKLAITRQQSEEKRAAAEARRNRQAAKTTQQVEYIRRTGRLPSSHFLCCKCFP